MRTPDGSRCLDAVAVASGRLAYDAGGSPELPPARRAAAHAHRARQWHRYWYDAPAAAESPVLTHGFFFGPRVGWPPVIEFRALRPAVYDAQRTATPPYRRSIDGHPAVAADIAGLLDALVHGRALSAAFPGGMISAQFACDFERALAFTVRRRRAIARAPTTGERGGALPRVRAHGTRRREVRMEGLSARTATARTTSTRIQTLAGGSGREERAPEGAAHDRVFPAADRVVRERPDLVAHAERTRRRSTRGEWDMFTCGPARHALIPTRAGDDTWRGARTPDYQPQLWRARCSTSSKRGGRDARRVRLPDGAARGRTAAARTRVAVCSRKVADRDRRRFTRREGTPPRAPTRAASCQVRHSMNASPRQVMPAPR